MVSTVSIVSRRTNLEKIVLLTLMDRGGISPVELAKDISVPVHLVSEVFEKLRESGLLEEVE